MEFDKVAQFRQRWNTATRLQRVALRLRCEGKTRAHIAEQMGIGVGTVDQHMARAVSTSVPDAAHMAGTVAACYWLGRLDERELAA